MKDKTLNSLFYVLFFIGLILSIAIFIALIYGISWLCMWFCNTYMNPSEPIGIGMGFIGFIFCILMFLGLISLSDGR